MEINYDKYLVTLKSANLYKKKPHKLMEMIYSGSIPTRNFPSSSGAYELDGIFRSSKSSENKTDFLRFLTFLSKKGVNMLDDGLAVRALSLMHQFKRDWVRDVSTWNRNTYNLDRQIKSIGRHLFCKYPIPKFMDNIWFKSSNWDFPLYLHLGKGESPRTFDALPVPITKRESHYFQLAPDDYTPMEAILWGKVLSFGGDERLVRAFMETRIFRATNKKEWEFWEPIMKFFVEQPLLDIHVISPVCDYISHLKNDFRRIPVAGGGFRVLPPEFPNFKINGRTLPALIRGMEAWHKELGKGAKEGVPKRWEPFLIDDYSVTFGKEENRRTYTFTQLLTVSALRAEGRTHGHCVAGYANSCNSGRTSIWSMCVEDAFARIKNLLTIEVSPQKRIVQCRGTGNRLANANEWRIVERFAFERKLDIDRWVHHE